MFNFKNLSGLSQLMMNAGSIPDRIKELREKLAQETITGGTQSEGEVFVELSGTGEIRKLVICETLVQSGSTDRIEEMLPAVLNEALSKVRRLHVEKMRELTGGIDLPGLDDALAGL